MSSCSLPQPNRPPNGPYWCWGSNPQGPHSHAMLIYELSMLPVIDCSMLNCIKRYLSYGASDIIAYWSLKKFFFDFSTKAFVVGTQKNSLIETVVLLSTHNKSCADPEGGGGAGGPDPPEKSQNIGFLSNSGLDPLKITKLPSQHSMLGHHRHASETPCKWRFTWRFPGGPMMARFEWYLDPPSPHQLKKNNKQNKTSKLNPHTKLSGSTHANEK